MHQRELDRDRGRAAASAQIETEFPGRRSASAALEAPREPSPSGIIMRKARDAAGVAPDADTAVAAAGGSSGAALPGELRTRFESSLGVDLGGVRVHTGAESQAASAAVGAKAYALGNDIHFGAGQYDPASSAGQLLIAHEVAHTVQQSGSAPGPQFKLAVSSAGDRAEVEADRAAEAMVVGAPATVSSAGTAIQRASCTPGAPDFNPQVCRPGPWSVEETERYYEGVNNYKPTNWLAKAGISAVDLGFVPPASSYKPTFETILHPSHASFRAVASVAVASTNALIAPITDYIKFAAEAEAADAPSTEKLHPNDPNSALENTKPSGSANKIKDAYTPDSTGIKADKTKITGDKLTAQGHADVKRLRDKLHASTGVIVQAKQVVIAKAGAVNGAVDAAAGAAAGVQQALNNSQIAGLDQKKTDWQADQAAFQSSVAVVKGAIGVIGAATAKDASAVGVVSATADLVEAGGNAYFTHQIQGIEKEKSRLQTANAQLSEIQAWATYTQALAAIDAAIAELTGANNAYEDAKVARTQIYADLAVEIDKALEANGMSKADRANVQSAVTAVPLMEKVIGRLDDIVATCVIPAYDEKNGVGATHCTNLGEFLTLVGDLQGYKDAAVTDRATWKRRLTAASDATKLVR